MGEVRDVRHLRHIYQIHNFCNDYWTFFKWMENLWKCLKFPLFYKNISLFYPGSLNSGQEFLHGYTWHWNELSKTKFPTFYNVCVVPYLVIELLVLFSLWGRNISLPIYELVRTTPSRWYCSPEWKKKEETGWNYSGKWKRQTCSQNRVGGWIRWRMIQRVTTGYLNK